VAHFHNSQLSAYPLVSAKVTLWVRLTITGNLLRKTTNRAQAARLGGPEDGTLVILAAGAKMVCLQLGVLGITRYLGKTHISLLP
jgi:hypothetical protein